MVIRGFGALFDIREGEGKGVYFLLLHAFLNGFGIAMCYAASHVLFVQEIGAESLSKGWAITSVVLLLSGYVYAGLEHKMKPLKLFTRILFFCSFLMLLVRGGFYFIDNTLFIYLLLSAYWLIYMLINLEFWGLAALMFDVRQSKRLFALVGSGETLAKIAGYYLSYQVIHYLGKYEVISIAAVCFILSALVLNKLKRMQRERGSTSPSTHDQPSHQQHHHELGIKTIIRTLRTDRFLALASVMALFGISVYFIIAFAFYSQVEITFKGTEEFAWFLALFMTSAKSLNYIFKALFSGRIIKRIGLKWAILALPILLLILNISGFIGALVSAGAGIFLWLFLINRGADELLRSSLNKPGFLVLFQPLHSERRLQGHTISKGIMEPIGMGLTGLLLILFSYLEMDMLKAAFIFLIAMITIWLIFSLRVNSAYLRILSEALKLRWLGHKGDGDFNRETFNILREKLKGDDPAELLYAYELADGKFTFNKLSLLGKMLRSEESLILRRAMILSREVGTTELLPRLKELEKSDDPRVSHEAIICICALLEEEAVDYFRNEYKGQPVFIQGLLKYAGLNGALFAGPDLKNLLVSPDPKDRITGAEIIGKIGLRNFFYPLVALLDDHKPEVVSAAIQACGKTRNERAIIHLLPLLNKTEHFVDLKDAFREIDRSGLMLEHFNVHDATRVELLRFLKILSAFNSHRLGPYFLEKLEHSDFQVQEIALNALLRMEYDASEDAADIYREVEHCTRAFYLLNDVRDYFENRVEKFSGAFENEVDQLRRRTLHMLSLVGDRDAFKQVLDSYWQRDPAYRANAIEQLESLVKGDRRFMITYLFDPKEEKRLKHLVAKRLFSPDELSHRAILIHLIQEERVISPWVKSVILRLSRNEAPDLLKGLDFREILHGINSPALIEESICHFLLQGVEAGNALRFTLEFERPDLIPLYQEIERDYVNN